MMDSAWKSLSQRRSRRVEIYTRFEIIIQECPLMGGDKHLKFESMHINAHKTSERDLLLH